MIVFRNDKVTLEECIALDPDRVVISPGPGWPKDSGVSGIIFMHPFLIEKY